MMMQRRREIAAEDEKVSGAGALTALVRQDMPIIRQVGTAYEFRHDQMRAFLAALWLVEETPTAKAIGRAVLDGKAFALNRRDQEELWRFVAPLLSPDEDLVALWLFASEDPADQARLLAALQAQADVRGVVLVRIPHEREEPMR
jgi:hypothetical protein